ncbi:MAG: ABC transporter ATP-binding protein [Desulfobacterales bacterium]|nr:ABC transporter ATP-binding protein [Desulfobacterales bacterium]
MQSDYGYFEEEHLGKPYDIKLLKRLYPFAKTYRSLFLWTIFAVILITLLDLSLPYVTKIAIDRYIVPGAHSSESKILQEKTRHRNAAEGQKKDQVYIAALADPAIRAIVQKHPDIFQINGDVAQIRFDALGKLSRQDLAGLRKKDLQGVGKVTAYFLILISLNFFLSFVQVILMEYAGQKIMHDLRMKLYLHIQSLSISFFNRNPVGRLVTRATNDIQNMHELFTSVIVFCFKDLFLLLGIAIVLLTINWKLAMVSFAVLPVVVYASISFSNRARDVFRVLRIKLAEINTRFAETLGGIKVIQLFLQEKENYRKFAKLNHESYLAGMQQVTILAVFMPIIELLGSIAVAMIIFYGGQGFIQGSISLGALVAFISYMKMFFSPIRDLAEKYNIMQNAMASAERIFLILDKKDTEISLNIPGPVTGSRQDAPVLKSISQIEFQGVSLSYLPGEPVLKEISLRVKAGEKLAIVGPTGSGKTSLINLLIRFYIPTAGKIFINGIDLRQIDPVLLRSRMALVMQDPFLFSGSIRSNIAYGKTISDKQMEHILRIANCRSIVERLPHGLDADLSGGGASISSGERQLISIARAFARDPDLLILDEATSYIDSETEQKIQEALANLMKNRTSIVIAHRLATARNADRIIVLNRMKIVESGTHAELVEQKGYYYKLNQLNNTYRAEV